MTDENENKKSENDVTKPQDVVDNLVITQHTAEIDGVELTYTVTTGTIVLKEEEEKKAKEGEKAARHKPKAEIFFIAYTCDDVTDRQSRPITFSFNGGPWLIFGLASPRFIGSETGGPG